MPINGYFGVRYSSVFGHLLPYVEQDNIYKLIVNTNGSTVLPPSINNARRADDSSATATFQRSVIPSFQAPSDPTAGPRPAWPPMVLSRRYEFRGQLLSVQRQPGGLPAPQGYTAGTIVPLQAPRLPATFTPAPPTW